MCYPICNHLSGKSIEMVKIFYASADHQIAIGSNIVPCAMGKGGVLPSDQKREGDGASPIGVWPIRYVFYRPDRLQAPETKLPLVALSPDDGWCDAPDHPLYNQRVKLPFETSHEKLWRDDHVYDLIGVLGHNDDPVVPKMGSAVFLHLARPDYSPTEGCVAVTLENMLRILRLAEADSAISISS